MTFNCIWMSLLPVLKKFSSIVSKITAKVTKTRVILKFWTVLIIYREIIGILIKRTKNTLKFSYSGAIGKCLYVYRLIQPDWIRKGKVINVVQRQRPAARQWPSEAFNLLSILTVFTSFHPRISTCFRSTPDGAIIIVVILTFILQYGINKKISIIWYTCLVKAFF